MNELVTHEEWYKHLVEECKAIVTEAVFTSRWALVEGYWLLGQRIRDDKLAQEYAKGNKTFVTDLSRNIKVGYRDVYRSLQLYDKYPDIDKLPEGKNISWNKLITKYLPDSKYSIEEINTPRTQKITNSIYGQIYQLGKHRLMCGDATKEEDVKKLMDGNNGDMIFTDPPFNIDLGHIANSYESHDDNMVTTAYTDLLKTMLINLKTIAPVAPFYVMSANRDIALMKELFKQINIHYHQLLIWAKPSGMMGNSDYVQNYEAITYGYTGEHRQVANKGLLACEIFNKDENIQSVKHPTSRPLSLLKKFILNSSVPGDIVVDTFGGSGSTLIACEKTDRICYMMELDPVYCDVIRERFANL